MKATGSIACIALLLTACAVGPDYQRPMASLPAQYTEPVSADTQTTAIVRDWWTLFNDAQLNELVTRALARNFDLQRAVARIEEATGVLDEVRAAQFPEVDLTGAATRNRVSQATTVPPSTLAPLIRKDEKVTLATAFELDFWGKLRRVTEAARAQSVASEYGKGVVELTLAGSVAQTYLALRSLDAQIAVSKQTLTARGDSFTIAESRFKGGLASGLDVEQARGAKAAVEAQLADLRQQRALAEHQLAVLTATPDLVIAAGDLRELPSPPLPPAGLPSALIDARPDIRLAEEQLVAANARIGVVKASLFPTISLTGSIGSQSGALDDLFTAKSGIWGVGVGLDFPIFAAGKYSSRLVQASAQQKQMLAAYQQAIHSGFREVRDALSSAAERAAQEAALDTQHQAALETLRIAQARYDAGYSPYLEVLDAQRTANDVTLSWIRTRRARLENAVELFKSLGGGWTLTNAHNN